MENYTLLVLTLIAIAMVGTGAVHSADYFVAPDGSDDNPGTEAAPWQTIAKANAAVKAGDTVNVLPGEYTDQIAPEASGDEGAPITYRATQWREAKLVTPEKIAIELRNRSYISVEDFAIDCDGSGRWVYATDCDHITVRGCHFRDARYTMEIIQSEQVKLLDNIFSKDRVTGNMISIRQCSFVLIEGNSLTRVGHSPMQITTCRNVVVRGNCFRNNWGRNYEFWATGRILIEDNVVT
ncbi:MAG: right-handed parallel beta-helix repeat-containing protein, partial [Armatimonadota bacterium]